MKILKPNIGKKIEYIVKDHVYVSITDYGKISLLQQIKISPGIDEWYWIYLKEGEKIDLVHGQRFSTFDKAINKAVNDPYQTIYCFENYIEMIDNFKKITYEDTISTFYQSKKEQG